MKPSPGNKKMTTKKRRNVETEEKLYCVDVATTDSKMQCSYSLKRRFLSVRRRFLSVKRRFLSVRSIEIPGQSTPQWF